MFIPSGWTDIFLILSKYAHLSQNKLCSQVWRLLYKNKQEVHRFYKFLVETIIELGFIVTQFDKTVFYDFSKIKDGNYIVIAAILNDFTIITDSKATTNSFLDRFKSHIKLVCLGNIN